MPTFSVTVFFPLKDNMPKLTFPVVTAALIALNVAIYFMASSNPLAAQNTAIFYGVIPYEVMNPGTQCVPAKDMSRMICGMDAEIRAIYPMIELPATWLTVATSMFLHGGLFHLISNMLFLFVFGGALENALGRLSFSMFYLVGGVAAVLGQTLWETGGMMPMVGASGAIAGVLAGYLVLFPSAKILSLLIIIPMRVRAFWVIGTWIGFQFIDAYIAAGEGGSGGVAYWAHIGGFAAGVALTYLIITSEQIAAFRREARVVSGLRVEPIVQPEPEVNRYQPPPHPGVAQDPFAVPQPQAQRPPAA
jgi:membrane associated rhomboid family serine protease